MQRSAKAIVVILLSACATSRPAPSTLLQSAPRVTALRYTPPDLLVSVTEEGGCRISDRASGTGERTAQCAERIRALPDGTLLVTWQDASTSLMPASGAQPRPDVVAASGGGEVRRSATGLEWRIGDVTIALPSLLNPTIEADDRAVVGMSIDRRELIRVSRDGTSARIFRSEAPIDSFDLDPKGGQLAVSASHESSYDVALVRTDGSSAEPTWIPGDALDERMVRWAPRGNKVAFVISGPSGSIVRSVHVPSGYQVSASVHGATITALEWEPKAERFAVALTSPTVSSEVDTMTYAGEQKIVEWRGRSIEREPMPLPLRAEVVFPPTSIKYGQSYPVLIVQERGKANQWSDSVAAAVAAGSVGAVGTAESGDSLTKLVGDLKNLPWVDGERIYLLSEGDSVPGAISGGRPNDVLEILRKLEQ